MALLTEKCWKLASHIMEEIEMGKLKIGKKRNTNRVFQSSFSCLTGIDPQKHEQCVLEILTMYANGDYDKITEVRRKYGFRPLQKAKLNTNTSLTATDKDVSDVSINKLIIRQYF